jgi:DNA-binding transcriptional regulator YdaS (Cro superfamily)
MQLSTWVEPHGRQTALAKAIGCPSQLVWQWASGERRVPEERCPAIEAATDGAVTCEEMRDDIVWHRVADRSWRCHPKGRPLNDVTRTSEKKAALA